MQSCQVESTRTSRYWTDEENELLRTKVKAYESRGIPIDWRKVAMSLPRRTNKGCRKRWHNVVAGVFNKGPWSQSEDDLLRRGVGQCGMKWTHVAEMVTSRSADQCAKRWQHSLDPKLDHSVWTLNDERILLDAVKKFGRHWTQIQRLHFQERSKNSIKNRYTILSRKLRKRSSDSNQQVYSVENPEQTTKELDDELLYHHQPLVEDDEDGDSFTDGSPSDGTPPAPHFNNPMEIDTTLQTPNWPLFSIDMDKTLDCSSVVLNMNNAAPIVQIGDSNKDEDILWMDFNVPLPDLSFDPTLDSRATAEPFSIDTATTNVSEPENDNLFLSQCTTGLEDTKPPSDDILVTLTLNKPSFETMQRLAQIAIENEGNFRFETG